MAQRAAYNPDNPFDALANLAKREIAFAGITIGEQPQYRLARDADVDLGEAMMCGGLTAICGIVMSHYEEDDSTHEVLLEAMTTYLPLAMDQARNILGLPPLKEKP